MALGVAALGLGLPCWDRRAGSALCLGHGLGFSVVDRSARAGGRGLVFGCQGACGLRPPCVACFVPSCACRLWPGSRPAIIPAAALPCGPWAGSVRFRCSRLHAQHNSVFPICQALFCKKISVRPITPLRGVKSFSACFPGRNDPALCARDTIQRGHRARLRPGRRLRGSLRRPFRRFGKMHKRQFWGEGGEYI